jgi:hypothetical protein
MTLSNHRPPEDIIDGQLKIAERWLERGGKSRITLEYEDGDPFSPFFFYFSGFNALYFLWRIADNLPSRPEVNHVEHLVRKFGTETAARLLTVNVRALVFFRDRPEPIQSMGRQVNGSWTHRDATDGANYQAILKDHRSLAVDQLAALGKIMYLIRCNLVHGSKQDRGDDRYVVWNAVSCLESLLIESLSFTRRAFDGA